ncbi:hypothetical protein BDZ45DRAFT_800653 [Acephala macrosclerotiorum]|nr:hypothetical protein BDZ45DRAFT_800653 [Acephala macrosclerotiorum]
MNFWNEPVAIVGTGCRFPGKASTPAKLWELLSHPCDLSSEIPQSRFNSSGFYHPDSAHHGTSNVQKSYFIDEDVRQFDSKFFNISSAEAESMDPQQRMLLEVVYEAIESANLSMENLRGTPTAVYVGLMCDDYSGLIFSDMESVPTYGATGAARSILSNRVSYFFDWTGPSYTIDSACSSSLVAVHQGVQALRNGDCSVALAAGANLILSPRMFIAESNLKMLSPNGRCRMWDADGDGYARGEGLAAVVLKRLSDAIADGDPITCVIRETHVNQGGRSTGLTVPNPIAQVNLIRQTYAKAGLDLNRPEDRPQYFQAHGTGTKVGDLNEATAIHNTFFNLPQEELEKYEKLYVGSIKTVIGHSEGAAGIAALLEAALAVQHGVIPPNLHFENLNPKLVPFYNKLEVPTKIQEWPLTINKVRRASCNSFGFGGTNAHVILENYCSIQSESLSAPVSGLVSLPFVFSAASERSLSSLLYDYSQFLDVNPDTNMNTLATTLLSRRSVFTHKISFTAQTTGELRSKLDAELERKANGTPRAVASRPSTKPKQILGIFTGQGAQWVKMGSELITSSSLAKETLDSLETCLTELPAEYKPEWSLSAQLAAPAEESRLGEAAICQPLCTAIQIILINHLRAADIKFSGVVGHSSGEIAAAYAAGFISASSAIKIAYLRGRLAKLAGASKSGAMLAVGSSMADAQDFCQQEAYQGRIVAAASNSSNSVTLSGDKGAIDEANEYFYSMGIFARKLKVDTAYHSHHMIPCSEPYLKALKDCGVELLSSRDEACTWYSSVVEGQTIEASDALTGQYWVDNMLHPVLFSQAVTASMAAGAYDFVIEVGPHPALKGPALQTMQEVSGSKKPVPYTGLLARGSNAIQTFADALGLLWMHFGNKSFSASAYSQIFDTGTKHTPIVGLPMYPWDHDKPQWYESRISREIRLRQHSPHSLLGITSSDEAEGEYKWRNYIRLNELPWLSGHQIQGQVIFPAAGYVVMALEGARVIANGKDVSLIEIQNLKILKAAEILDDTNGVETMFTVKIKKDGKEKVEADWTCHACLNKDTGSLVLAASGSLILRYGESSAVTLPKREQKVINDLRDVDIDTFYESLTDVGYGYTGAFRGITSLQQKLDFSTGIITDRIQDPDLILHPGTIDTAIQTLFACLGTPGDGSLWSMHIPVLIKNIRVNPFLCNPPETKGFIFDASLADSNNDNLCGDVTLFESVSQNAIMQIEGIEVKPLMPATADDDRHLFHELVWGVAEPDASLVYRKTPFSSAEIRKAEVLEMLCIFYLKELDDTITSEEREQCTWHGKRILDFARYVVDTTKAGTHKSCKIEWLENTWEDVMTVADQYASDVDYKLIHIVGTKLIPFIRGQATIVEHMMADGLLNSYYQNSELLEYNEYAGAIAAQIAFRYPLIKVLEIGGGTGGATRAILKHIDNHYSSYTFTDISVAFFEQAQETFKDNGRIIYESLDVEQDPTAQGFTEHSYDLVIASNVLHATKVLDQTMTNVRKLLKPGGKLLVLEAIDNGATRVGFSFCGVPGWWAGADDGRALSPLITPAQWNELLLRNGFSGLDTITPGTDSQHQPVAVFVSSAVDEQISLLQKPLLAPAPKPQLDTLFLVGGATEHTKKLIQDLKTILREWSADIQVFESMEQLENVTSSLVHVLNLAELDSPIFQGLTPSRLESFKYLLNISKSFLWVTAGARSSSSYSSMALGIGRTLVHEMPHLRVQVLDSDKVEDLSAESVAEAFLRVALVETWENDIYAPKMMWSNEPELWLEDGKAKITRVVAEKDANKRLMSKRRVVEEEVDLDNEVVDVISNSEGYELVKRLPEDAPSLTRDMETIKVSHSTSLALKITDAGYLYLVIGEPGTFGCKVIALSNSLGSAIATPKSWILPWSIVSGDEPDLLSAISSDLIAQSLMDAAPQGTTILLLEPPQSLATAVSRRARLTGIKPCLITTKEATGDGEWVTIHPFSTDREVKSKLSKDVSIFFDFSTEQAELRDRITSLLPNHCVKGDSEVLSSTFPQLTKGASLRVAADRLGIALASSLSELHQSKSSVSPEVIAARDLPSMLATDGLKIVDWTASSLLPVRVQSAESLMRFKADRTYLLAGLSGNLGRSLCQWMILHGAKHIVLTSRKPQIDQSWLDEMYELGGEIKIMAMDISDRDSLLATHKEITSTLPPVAGVANAAMVLGDTLLSNMTFSGMQSILKPKVDGSRFLDELFPSNDLDFFILFGSSVDVMGNSGQSAYCAANMFMNSLVSSRRKRGLAGSLIGLGEVKGVGYAARMNRKLNDIIGATLPLSEKEVHHMFAEGVLSGKPDSGRNPAMYAGMDSKDPKKDPDILWYPHPKFWHYIESGNGGASVDASGAVVSLKTRLAEAAKMEDVLGVVTDGFTNKLKHKLQMSSGAAVSPDTVLQELGIDSLVAVDLRAWFVTELGVDMPILKILGGSTITDLVTDAVGRLSPTLLPCISVESSKVLVPNGLGGHDLVAIAPAPVVVTPVAEPESTNVEVLPHSEAVAPAPTEVLEMPVLVPSQEKAIPHAHLVVPAPTEVIEMPILVDSEEEGPYGHSKNLSISTEATYAASVFSQVNSSASSLPSLIEYGVTTDQWKSGAVSPTSATSSDEADKIGTLQSEETLERGEAHDGIKGGDLEVIVNSF